MAGVARPPGYPCPREDSVSLHPLRRIASVLSVIIVLGSVAGWGLSNRYVNDKKTVNVFSKLDQASRPQAVDTAGMTILAVAVDDRTGLTRAQQNALHVGHGNYGAARTDTIMVIRIAPNGGGATAVSLPRDTWVDIPAYTDTQGQQHAATQDRINTLLERGGPQLLTQVVESLTGMRIDHYISLNFAGFLTMVDAVGGVPMCIPKALKDASSGLDLAAGQQTLTGRQALAYVRARHIDSDFGRMQRQQRFLSSMAQRVASAGTLLNPLKLNGFIDAAMKSITTDETLGRDAIMNLAQRFRGLSLSKIRFLTVPISNGNANINGNSVVLWDQAQAKTLFTDLANDRPVVLPAATAAAAPTTSGLPTVAPGVIRLTVLNATNITGLARRAATSLAKVGFGFAAQPGNAPTSGATATVVEFPKAMAEAARTVAASIPFATLQQTADASGITILVGKDWTDAKTVKLGAATSASSGTTSTTAVVQTITAPRTAADSICK